MPLDHVREEPNNPNRVAPWRIALYIIGAIALILVAIAGIWGLRVAVSEPRGAGDQEIIVNDGRNRVNAQEWFASMYGQIKSADAQLDQAAANVKANPGDEFHLTNYTGLRNRCLDMVARYDAEALKVSRGKWISPDLPERINTNDPSTNCEEKSA